MEGVISSNSPLGRLRDFSESSGQNRALANSST